MYCSKCGAKNSNTANFCKECGKKLVDVVENPGGIRKAIKAESKASVKGTFVGSMVLYPIIMIVLMFVLITIAAMGETAGSIGVSIIAVICLFIGLYLFAFMFAYGFSNAIFDHVRGKEVSLKNVFIKPFDNLKIVLILFGTTFLGILCMGLVNIIPIVGIVLTVYFVPTFDMLFCLYTDDNFEKLSWTEMIKKANEIVKGHRVEYYGMYFSFIGWFFLGILTLGILYIWLIPYVRISVVNMYRRWTSETDFEVSKKGLGNGAVIGISLIGYFAFVIIAFILAFIAIVDENASDVLNNIKDPESFVKSSINNGNVKTFEGLNVYIPDDYVLSDMAGYDYYYQSGASWIGVQKIASGMTLDKVADMHRTTIVNSLGSSWSCSEPAMKTINGKEWALYTCDYGTSSKIYVHITNNDDYTYILPMSTDNEDLIKKIERNLKFN